MTHTFTVPTEVFEALQGNRRHLFVKDSAKYATEDKAIIQLEEPVADKVSVLNAGLPVRNQAVHRDELQFDITMIEHGPESKHVNSHYALVGLYAPYTANGEIKEVELPQRAGMSKIEA